LAHFQSRSWTNAWHAFCAWQTVPLRQAMLAALVIPIMLLRSAQSRAEES
jgi:hypothetical protein